MPIYSPDGKTIASYQKDQIYLTDSTEFKQIAKYKVNSVIKSLQYSPDGKFLLLFGEDSKLHLLSAVTGEQLGESDILPYGPSAVTFSPDSKFVTSLDAYINFNRWKVPEMKLDKTQTYLPLTLPAVFSDHTNYLAITSNGIYSTISKKYSPSSIVVLDANTLEQIYLLEGGHDNAVGGLAFSPDGKILASTDSITGIVNLWDMSTGKLSHTLEVTPGKRFKEMDFGGILKGVAFSQDGNTIAAVASWVNEIFLWNVSSGELIDSYIFPMPKDIPSLHPYSVYFISNSLVVINGQFIWDLEKREWTKNFITWGIPNPRKTLYVFDSGCVVNGDWRNRSLDEFCVTTSNNWQDSAEGQVFTGKILSNSNMLLGEVFAFNPRGNILLQASDTGLVVLWKIKP